MVESMGMAGGTGEHFQLWDENQRKYVELRISGLNMQESADACKIHKNTATNWEKHRPELRIREAIAAGQELKVGLGAGAAAEHVITQVGEMCREVSTGAINVEVMQYAAKAQLALSAIKTLERNMVHAPRAADQNQAAIALLKFLRVEVTVDRTMSASEVSANGLSVDGKQKIEEQLLGVSIRTAAWDTMRAVDATRTEDDS